MTSLAQQLKRLAVPQAQASTVTHDKHRKSLLFDAKEAASLDRETFYALGECRVILIGISTVPTPPKSQSVF